MRESQSDSEEDSSDLSEAFRGRARINVKSGGKRVQEGKEEIPGLVEDSSDASDDEEPPCRGQKGRGQGGWEWPQRHGTASENKDRSDNARISKYVHFAFTTMEGVEAALGQRQ